MARRLIGGGRELRIAAAAEAAHCNAEALPGTSEIVQQLMLRLPVRLRARRNQYSNVLAVFAVPLGAFTVRPAAGLEGSLVLEVQQRVHPVGTLEVNVSAAPSVSTARPPAGHELLPSESDTPVSSSSGNDLDPGAINEHSNSGGRSSRKKEKDPGRGPSF
jgi:hypothetical protein